MEVPLLNCWACSMLVGVPTVDGRPASAYKCGFCGAINEFSQQCKAGMQLLHIPPISDLNGPMQQHYVHEQAPQQQQQVGQYHNVHVLMQVQQVVQHQQQLKLLKQHSNGQMLQGLQHSGTASHGNRQWQLQSQQNQHQNQQQAQPARQRLLASCLSIAHGVWRLLIVVFVTSLILSIAGTGILLLLPRLCTSWPTYLLNLGLASLATVNVLINYAASVWQSPGKVAEYMLMPMRGPEGQVLQGSYEGWSWCSKCQAAKPPQAHHCRSCRLCIIDMDHHCPFINNCVGRANLRPFLLFLIWTLLAALYVLAMCSLLVWLNWHEVASIPWLIRTHGGSQLGSSGDPSKLSVIRQGLGGGGGSSSSSWPVPAVPDVQQGSHSIHLDQGTAGQGQSGSISRVAATAAALVHWLLAGPGLIFVLAQVTPGWLLATYYLVAVSAALLVAVGALLLSQLRYLSQGVTYVQQLKGAGVPNIDRADTADGVEDIGEGKTVAQHQQLPATAPQHQNGKQPTAAMKLRTEGSFGLRAITFWQRLLSVLVVGNTSNCSSSSIWGVVHALLVP